MNCSGSLPKGPPLAAPSLPQEDTHTFAFQITGGHVEFAVAA